MASPVNAASFNPVSDGATACDHLKELANTRAKVKLLVDWLLDSNDEFDPELLQTFLFDAAKKGWFVQTNPTTGLMELIEKIPLDGLDDGGANAGDKLIWDGTEWLPSNQYSYFGAPTSGSATLPDPDVGSVSAANHGIGSVPTRFGCFLDCTVADAGYGVGYRVDAQSLHQIGGGGEDRQGITVGVSGTQVFAVFVVDGTVGRKYALPKFSAPNQFDVVTDGYLTPASWDVKLWAEL